MSACSASVGSTSGAGPIDIVTSSYPMTFVAERVGGEHVTVVNLASEGGDSHDLELSPRQVTELQNADIALYLGAGFQAPVEQAVSQRSGASVDGMDSVTEEQLRPNDPHVWFSPLIMAQIGESFAEELAGVDPANAADYEANAAALREEMTELDEEYHAGLQNCASTQFLTSHEAFGYLADAYGLEQVGVMGINPEAEPSPRRLLEVEQLAKEQGIEILFVESTDTSGAKLADSLGLEPVLLDTLDVTPSGHDYTGAMRLNLEALQAGLGCE